MLKYFKKINKISIKKIVFISFFMIIFIFLVKQSLAQGIKETEFQGEVSNAQAIKTIEKVLISPKGSIIINDKPKITINRSSQEVISETKSNSKNTNSNSDFASISNENIEENKQNDITSKNPEISIEIIKKMDSNANRLKETAAYNAMISNQYEAALELYKQILIKESDNHYAKFGLATAYHKLKQYDEAKKHYYELLSTNIENKNEVIANFIEILVNESPIDAKYILARLSSQSPNTDYILARSALAYDKINKKDDAILLLKRAININSKNIEYQINLAIILDKNNEPEEALKYYKRSLRGYVDSGNNSNQINLASIRKRINFLQKIMDGDL